MEPIRVFKILKVIHRIRTLKELRNYVLHINRVRSLFFNNGLSKSAFSTYYYGELAFYLFVFYVFFGVMNFEFHVIFTKLERNDYNIYI